MPIASRKPNLSMLHVFGCRANALPTHPQRPNKPLLSDAHVCIFLRFSKNMNNIRYYNTVSELVKTTQHAASDKAMNDLAYNKKPPNASLLSSIQDGQLNYMEPSDYSMSLEVVHSPFSSMETFTTRLQLGAPLSLGFEYTHCSCLQCPFVSSIPRPPISLTPASF